MTLKHSFGHRVTRTSLIFAFGGLVAAALAACGGTETEPNEFYGSSSGDTAEGTNGDGSGAQNSNGGGGTSGGSTSNGGTSGSNGSNGSSGSSGASGSSGSSGTQPPGNGTDSADPAMKGIVAAHNLARSRVSPAAATPIPPLNWSDSDAAVAKAYASKCIFSHNANRGPRGENLYASSGGGNTPEKVVLAWENEKSQYNYANNNCSGVCGHYTQVVWSTTTTVGCAVQQCTQNSPFGGGAWEIWVCNYSPPGNYQGKKPY